MREAVAASLFGSSSSLEREQKAKTLHKTKERKRIKDRYLNQARLTSPKFQLWKDWEQRAPRPHFWEQRYSKKEALQHASSSYQG
jgi:hypothetical protein